MSQRRRSRGRLLLLGAGLVLILLTFAACRSPEPAQVTATPTKTPKPLPVLATATKTPAPATATLAPTVPPPTNTPVLTPTQSVEPSPTPWPTLAENVCPLTGLQVSDPALLNRRPMAVKVQNAALSRPQSGLPLADIVYEHLTEAAITRFTAIYLCQSPTRVGSTRSARFIDLELAPMYRALMVFSGTSPGLYPKFVDADFKDREFVQNWGWHADAFFRDAELRAKGVPIEHTLFVNAPDVWRIAQDLGINQRQELDGLTFDTKPPAPSEPATHISVPFPSSDMKVDWRYDAASGKYLRWVEGKPHLDVASGAQLAAANVVVVYVNHVNADFYEDYPRTNWPSVQIQLWGTGPMLLFRDGQVYRGLWARPERDEMLLLRDPTGQTPVPLKPGNTWVELVPLPGHRWAFEAAWDGGG
jgi:hypothetical protein